MLKKLIYASAAATIMLASCEPKKEEVKVETPSYQKADESAARAELDKALDDVDKVVNDNSELSGARTSAADLPCGVVEAKKQQDGSYKINYGVKTPCGVKKISGYIKIELIKGKTFAEAGAILKATFVDYLVEYQASKATIKFNGVKYITNLTGSSLKDILTKDSIVHKVRAYNLQLTFNNGTGSDTTKTWTVARKQTWDFDGAVDFKNLYGKVEGDTSFTINGKSYSNVTEFGDNKEGQLFVNEVSTPFKWSNCGTDWTGPYVLKTGVATHSSSKAAMINGYKINIDYTFTVKAGYKLNGITPVFDGSCSSAGYLLQANVPALNYNVENYQPY